jgi:hypothetical protein
MENTEVAGAAEAADTTLADLAAYRAGQAGETVEQSTEQPPTTEAAATEVAASTEKPAAESEPDPASEAGKELAKKRGSLQARIDAIAAEREAERARAASMAARLAAAEAELARVRQPAEGKPATKPADEAEPKFEDFETFEKWDAARVEWRAKQVVSAELAKRDQAAQQAATQQHVAQRLAAFGERAQKYAEGREGYLAKVQPLCDAIPIESPLGVVIADSEVGPAIAEHYADHVGELQRLGSLPPALQFRELWRLEAKLEASAKPVEEPAKPAPKVVSKAPEPVKPVTGAPAGVTPDPDDIDSLADFRRHKKALLER